MAFPSISFRPLNFTQVAKDNAIRAEFEGGYEHRRQRYTRNTYTFTVTYDLIDSTAINSIQQHYDSVGTGTAFDWTDPDSVVHNVYYDVPISYQSVFPGWYRIQPINFVEL